MLKLVCPGEEEEHEHLALQRWGGDGAVRLLRADPARRAMLLERLDQRDLTEVPVLEACEIVAGLYARLHVPALPQLRPQTLYIERWTETSPGCRAARRSRTGSSSRRCRSGATSSTTRPASGR